MLYRLYIVDNNSTPNAVTTVDSIPGFSFLFDPEQPLYQQFKIQINDDTAQLEDADGNLMTPEEAKAFVATLP